MSVSGHKVHGPKGIGFIYVKENNRIKPILTGGGQEIGIRSGTENTPGIYGLGEAIRIINEDLDGKIEKIKNLRDLLQKEIMENIEDIKINSPEDGVCHILNVTFYGIKGEVLLHYLEQKGVYVSTGSVHTTAGGWPHFRKGGETMRFTLTFYVGRKTITISIVVKSKNRHSAK